MTLLEQRALSRSIQVSVRTFWCPGAPARRRRGREVVPLRRHCAPAREKRVRETLEGEVRADARHLHSAPARVELPQHPLDMAIRGLQQL